MTQPDILYYNLSMICKKTNPTDPDVIAKFQEGRQSMLLANAKDYTFSIVRFTLNANNLPILIPKIQTGQNDVNLTNYGMQLSFDNGTESSTTYPFYLEYDCRNKYFQNNVSSPLSGQMDDPYYYMLNIQHFVDMFNSCLSNCYSLLRETITTISESPPELVYNGDDTFSMYFNTEDFAPSNQFNLYLNDDLYNLLRNFNYATVSNGSFNHKMLVSTQLNNQQTINNINYTIIKQFAPSIDNWSPIQSIIFRTSLLGVNPEKVSQPVQLSNNYTFYSQNANATEDILTDIILPINNPTDYNSLIVYVANVYREANIIQDSIQRVDLTVGWKNKFNGQIYDMLLSDGDEITAKIKFQRYKNFPEN